MEQPLAVNRFTITRPLFYEGMLRVTKERLGPFIKKMLLVLAALWVVLTAVTVLTKGSPTYPIVELVVLTAVGVWLGVYIPRSRASRAWKALAGGGGGPLERVTRFYADRLEIDSGGEPTVIPYENVQETLSTEHLLVLTCRDKVGVLLALDGFEAGSADSVRALIRRGIEAGGQGE